MKFKIREESIIFYENSPEDIDAIEFFKQDIVSSQHEVIVTEVIVYVSSKIWADFFQRLVSLNFSIEDRLKLCHAWLIACTDTMCFDAMPFEYCLIATKRREQLLDMVVKSGYKVSNKIFSKLN